MKLIKRIFKWIVYILLIPFTYLIISLILSYITIDRKEQQADFSKSIYLSTNGVHLDIVIPKENLDSLVLKDLKHFEPEAYFSFGWGDENFYINTPTWNDLTVKNAFSALILKSSTLMHVTRYKEKRSNWIEVKVNASELKKVNAYLLNTFETNKDGQKITLNNKGYTSKDDFYKAKGSYSCINTCNSWVNNGFKEAGLKACLWTPFDFVLLKKHQ
ncbi:DUF2459 domain-containing protein [Winogradskyella eckloniae]|uniref:DUF2459 domain-containing protein n=1 Tax=Winogradskyella eckloniae TaxID=1089306 RepID=UPI001563E590|nr:DUF2459 domain-containing protein [Winogradskyella eckloniae]NRD21456.1 DUF2459 domain-containing protein [Winogradskyella eckloniae]